MKFWTFLFLLIIGVLFVWGMAVQHEYIHKAIYEDYGINSTISYFKNFPDFVTIGDSGCKDTNCILAHELNEIVGYPLLMMSGLIFILLCFIILEISESNDLIKLQLELNLIKENRENDK